MKIFNWVFIAVVLLESLQCLGRPNYQNVVVLLGSYLFILIELSNQFKQNTRINTLRLFLLACFVSCLFDLWYLVFGSIVARANRRWRRG